jgi:plasmid stabilization system protein ParE
MVNRKIIWTETAAKQRREVFQYWNERNKTITYSEKLIEITRRHLEVISKNPRAFQETEIPNLRESAMGHFSLYYKFTEEYIVVVAFWDNRQDPKNLLKLIS